MKAISQATLQDQANLHLLLDKANEYSSKLSNRVAWENVKKAKNAIDQQLERGNIFVIRNKENSISSSITLSTTNNLWKDLNEDNALYFTKLIKDPDKAKSDEAMQLLIFAALEAKRHNKLLLRCDAMTDNKGIISYYKKLGFTERGNIIHTPSQREGTLLEIKASYLLKK